MYYLQSRYYDPELGRFLNADSLVSTGQGSLGNNMFSYCNNSPVSFEDSCGYALRPCTTVINDGGYAYPLIPNIEETPEEQTSGVINGQDLLPYSQSSCGLGTYDHNGCAPIAIYNAMQLVGNPQSLQSVTDSFFWDYGMVAFGLAGIGPWSMDNYFDGHGVRYTGSFYESKLTNDVSEGSVIVFTVMLSGGWHAMSALYTRGKYMVFNEYDNSSKAHWHTSLSETYPKGWWVYGYRIDP